MLASFRHDDICTGREFPYLSVFGTIEHGRKCKDQDTVAVDSRFQVLAAVDCPNLGRTKGNWYKAVPPLARCYTGLTPGDYFGRAMVANLPSNVRVGIINVAVGGLVGKNGLKD